MPFLLYEVVANGNRSSTFRHPKRRALGGKQGPIASYVRKQGNGLWHMTEADLLRHYRGAPDENALVIDLKPKARGNVSLYRIRDIWGHSRDGWTPMLLRLEALFVDLEEPDSFKAEFKYPPGDGRSVYEFLYAIGDAENGSWKWGRSGSVNAALLFPCALDYLLGAIQERRRREKTRR